MCLCGKEIMPVLEAKAWVKIIFGQDNVQLYLKNQEKLPNPSFMFCANCVRDLINVFTTRVLNKPQLHPTGVFLPAQTSNKMHQHFSPTVPPTRLEVSREPWLITQTPTSTIGYRRNPMFSVAESASQELAAHTEIQRTNKYNKCFCGDATKPVLEAKTWVKIIFGQDNVRLYLKNIGKLPKPSFMFCANCVRDLINVFTTRVLNAQQWRSNDVFLPARTV